MGKYIIEIHDTFVEDCGVKKLLLPVKLNECGSYYLPTGITLTPYTEHDLEQVNAEKDKIYDEARDRGYEEGKARGYQEGLFDAWEAARKIASDNAGRNYSIFGQHFTVEILNTHSASEAIEKIRQYDQEQEEIKVGDEVLQHIKSDGLNPAYNEKAIILSDTGIDSYYVMYSDGLTAEVDDEDLVGKTGRHFPEIAEVLQKMKEDNNGNH